MEIKEMFEEIDKLNFNITKIISHRIKEGIDCGLSHAHIYLLMFLKNEGECMVTDIAKHLDITLSAVTNLTDKLSSHGLISRERRESDRRVVVISLKEEGIKVLQRICENRNRIFQQYFSNLTEDEMEVLLRITRKISENVIKLESNEI